MGWNMKVSKYFLLLVLSLMPVASAVRQGERAPSWSPDGTKIAFVGDKDGDTRAYIMSADGSGTRLVTSDTKKVDAPDWSPEGKRLAVSVCTNSAKDEWDIYVVDVDGSHLQRLTHDKGDSAQPAWSPDGKSIAFTSATNGPYQIYVMNADGSNRRQVTQGEHPSWSPDGKKLAFTKWGGPGTNTFQIYTVYIDGTDLREVTDKNLLKASQPAWSPDGSRIAFVATPALGGVQQIYVIGPDGSSLHALTQTKDNSFHPNWSADGKWIAFASGPGVQQHIYVMDAAGSNVRQLTGGKS